MSLLDNAKAYKRVNKNKFEFADEDLELIEAWLNDEVSHSQILGVKKFRHGNNIYSYLALGSKLIHQRNKK